MAFLSFSRGFLLCPFQVREGRMGGSRPEGGYSFSASALDRCWPACVICSKNASTPRNHTGQHPHLLIHVHHERFFPVIVRGWRDLITGPRLAALGVSLLLHLLFVDRLDLSLGRSCCLCLGARSWPDEAPAADAILTARVVRAAVMPESLLVPAQGRGPERLAAVAVVSPSCAAVGC